MRDLGAVCARSVGRRAWRGGPYVCAGRVGAPLWSCPHGVNRAYSPRRLRPLQTRVRASRPQEYLAHAYPFWNATAGKGLVRHLLLNPCDHGPLDCEFSRSSGDAELPPDIAPRDRRRKFAFVEFNGVPQLSWFIPSLDIRVPSTPLHEARPPPARPPARTRAGSRPPPRRA